MPNWVVFDEESLVFRGNTPINAGRILNIIIEGKDSDNNEFVMSFSIRIEGRMAKSHDKPIYPV